MGEIDAFKQRDVIFNAAGCPHPSLINEDSIRRERDHIESICRLSTDKWVIHCSTPSVLGYGDEFYEEASYREAVTPYGLLKRESEQRLMDSFPKLTVLRIFSITSVLQQKQIVWDAFRKLKAGEKKFSISPGQMRDFVHQVDLQRYLNRIFESEMTGIINITNTESTDLRNLIKIFGEILDCENIQFEENEQEINYHNLTCNKSSLFSAGTVPKYPGMTAPVDIFHQLSST